MDDLGVPGQVGSQRNSRISSDSPGSVEAGLSANAREVLKRRYLQRDGRGELTETPEGLFQRVARHVAQAEANYGPASVVAEVEQKFGRMMCELEFLPNSPTLMNAEMPGGQLAACFVLPIEDSIEGIFTSLGQMARIHQTGGGTGFDFSRLRPRSDLVRSTMGHASGPLSFLGIFDKTTEVIVQGGRRRGANMGILRCDHPDIVDFVDAKAAPGALGNFNLSVGITARFMRALKHDRRFPLVNPRTGRRAATIQARTLFDRIVKAAWRTGDPGLVFLDHVNRHNPTPALGAIEATNPCGEVPLLPYESCVLASINLARMVRAGNGRRSTVDWVKLRDRVHWGIRFLDDVLDVNQFPLEAIEQATLANRKIGLGVMGFADMLFRLGISYTSPQAVVMARKLMRFVRAESLAASAELAVTRGAFPNFERSIHASAGRPLRHATVNTIAPTGTISILAGASSGIEPVFAIGFTREVLSGTHLHEVNPWFEEVARERGFYRDDLLADVAKHRSLREIEGIPRDVQALFVTAFDVPPRQHVEIQAAFQKYTDNAVSKTINLPEEATVDEVRDIFLLAHRLRCKGITIYRYGSKPHQVLSTADATIHPGHNRADSEGCASEVCDS